jgi:trafficking protein particle complex subunit 2
VLQNNPLYLQSFTEADDALKLHHIVHCSLDVIDERGNLLNSQPYPTIRI